MPEYGQVSVYGNGIGDALLKTKEARLIQFRNRNGELKAMFVRLTEDVWGFITPSDDDWESNVKMLEIKDV